jgi:signal transduction histidine kinase
MRDEFFRLVGHELRSPLTAVQLQVDALAMIAHQGATAAAIEQRADRVRRSAQRLSWIVDEMVDLGRAVGSRLVLHPEEADLVALVRRVLDRFADECTRAGCAARLRAGAPVMGRWDVARVEHAIGSLLLVATRSGAGQPIELEVSGGAPSDTSARVAVRDGGPGLPAPEYALVFLPFDRLLQALPPASPVLSLWLVRAVAETHGGRLALAPGLAELDLPKTGDAGAGLIAGGSGPP